jgi:hypothetical protein
MVAICGEYYNKKCCVVKFLNFVAVGWGITPWLVYAAIGLTVVAIARFYCHYLQNGCEYFLLLQQRLYVVILFALVAKGGYILQQKNKLVAITGPYCNKYILLV